MSGEKTPLSFAICSQFGDIVFQVNCFGAQTAEESGESETRDETVLKEETNTNKSISFSIEGIVRLCASLSVSLTLE